MSDYLKLTRYTYPEQLSSRQSLQLTSPKVGLGGQSKAPFTLWTELHPSRRLPSYAIQSLLEVGHELTQNPSRQLARTLCCEIDPVQGLSQLSQSGVYAPQDLVFASPLIVEEAIAGETLSAVLTLSKSRGWSELPVPVALGVMITAARALAHLHSLGFYHGSISSDALMIRYVSADENSSLSRLSPRGGSLLTGWVRGNLFQLTPEAEAYGRGPSADCRALLWTLLELIGGEASVREEAGLRIPTSSATSLAQVSPQTAAALEMLPRNFALWVWETLQSPPPHMGAMLSQLQRVLDPSQPAFTGPDLSRWLSRLAPERVLQWERVLIGQDPQGLQLLSQSGGVLTLHQVNLQSEAQPNDPANQASAESSSSIAQASGGAAHPSQISSRRGVGNQAVPQSESSGQAKGKAESKAKGPQGPKQSWIERFDAKLDHLEERIGEKLTQDKYSKYKLRVALIWRDTITEIHEFDTNKALTIGESDDADICMPHSVMGEQITTLMTPSSEGEVVMHAPLNAKGWVQNQTQSPKRSWGEIASDTPAQSQDRLDTHLVHISRGGMGAIIKEDVGLFFQLYQPETKALSSFKLPIPTQNMGALWCLALAVIAHMMVLVFAYSSRDFQPRSRRIAIAARFVEMSAELEELESKEPDELDEPQLLEEEEVVEYDDSQEPVYDDQTLPELPSVKDKVKELANERFGTGEEKAKNLADFLAGDLKTDGAIALGDVSSALGTSSDSSLSLGSSFGDVGGQVTLGPGGTKMNTSGGKRGARRAGALKGKRVSRKVKGRVKPLKSRVRVTGGKLSKADVFKVISKNQAKINACYERQLMKSPNLSGKLTISWLIKPNGRVSNAKQVLSSIKSAPLKKCILGVFKKMRFPKPKGGSVKIKYPLVFQQG
jgi:hypothetical protein